MMWHCSHFSEKQQGKKTDNIVDVLVLQVFVDARKVYDLKLQ